ncbi:MAG TPA: hypothetical protein VKH62_15205, partial [Candidatus Binatia bacterium]|nr:hypothetical protein [Candidatus Binatia bacterium]
GSEKETTSELNVMQRIKLQFEKRFRLEGWLIDKSPCVRSNSFAHVDIDSVVPSNPIFVIFPFFVVNSSQPNPSIASATPEW